MARGLVRPLVVAGVVAIGVIALIWGLGGFRSAAAAGRPAAAGDAIRLERWTITIESCELTDTEIGSDYTDDPAVRVWVRIVNRTDATLLTPVDGFLTARLGSAELAEPMWAAGQQRYALNFDPDVAVEGAYDFALPEQPDPSKPVTVVVHRERNRTNFVLDDNWMAAEPAAAVTMTCPDRRRGSS